MPPNRRRALLIFLAAVALSGTAAGIVIRRRRRQRTAELPAGAPEGSGDLREVVLDESVTTEVNAKAPAFAGGTLDGETVRSIDFLGQKVLLLEFWSVFCTSCIQEMPVLGELHRKYRDAGLAVVGVNTDFFPPERVLRFYRRLDPPPGYPVIHDRDQEISEAFNVTGLPVTVLIDAEGWIRHYQLGFKPEDRETLEDKVRTWTKRIRETTETVRPVGGKTPLAVGRTTLAAGSSLPDVPGLLIEGRRMSLTDYRRGRPLAIFAWSLFCQPCRQEMPWLSREAERLAPRGVAFLSVNVDTARLGGQVRTFLAKQKMPFPTVLDAGSDPPGGLGTLLGLASTPTVLLVGADGTVTHSMVGEMAPKLLTEGLEALAARVEAGSPDAGR